MELFVLLIMSPVILETYILLYMLLLAIAWMVLTSILMIIFRMVQFFLLRIVDAPNGPVLALSGLLVGMAAFVKAFL